MTADTLIYGNIATTGWVNAKRKPGGEAGRRMNKNSGMLLAGISDEVLAARIQAGQNELISELVRRHSDRLFGVICRLVPARPVAEDLLQDTWVRIVHKFHLYNPERPLVPWLVTVAVNCCRDHRRKERVRNLWKFKFHPDKEDDPMVLLPDEKKPVADMQLDISKALHHLSGKLRKVVVLKFFSGLTIKDIAQALDIPEGTVKSRLHVALNKMREHFQHAEEMA